MELHQVANFMERRSAQALPAFREWLFASETLLKEFNLPQMSKLSSLRAQLAHFVPENRVSKKKERFHFASNLLAEAQECLWTLYTGYQQKVSRAKEIINQLLGVVYQSGEFEYKDSQDFTAYVSSIWEFCCSNEQLSAFAIQVSSQFSRSDILRLIADEIEI